MKKTNVMDILARVRTASKENKSDDDVITILDEYLELYAYEFVIDHPPEAMNDCGG
jgi:hypothetical protein